MNKLLLAIGLLFATSVIASYSPKSIICDPTTTTQCAKVDSSGRISIDGSTYTQTVSGTVGISGSVPVTGTFWQATQPVSLASIPLASGAATSALQATANSSLASIDSKLTSPLAVTGTFFQATQPVSIASSVAVTGPLTDTQLRASAVPVSAASLPLPTGAATSALQSSMITALGSPFQAGGYIGNTAFGISGTLPAYASTPTFNLGTLNGAATSALQGTANSSLASIDSKLTSPLTVTGPLTDTQLRASAVPVSLASVPLASGAATASAQATGNASLASIDSKLTSPLAIQGGNSTAVKVDGSAVTQPVSAASLPLPSNAAQETGGNLASINTKLPSQGQALSAASHPVVIASDQSAIETQVPLVVAPQTSFNYTTTGVAAQTQVTPGGWYAVTVQIPTITGATYTLASATTTIGSAVVTMASTTGAQIGQLVTGTGIPTGAMIVAVNTNVSITLNVPATANGTVTLTNTSGQFVMGFQQSTTGSSWSSINAIPKTIVSQQAATSTAYGPGLWLIQAPAGVNYLRGNITTMSGMTANVYIDAFQIGNKINLPFMYTATQANWPSGASFIPPIETSFLADLTLDLQTFSGTGQTITWYQSSDPNLANKQGTLASNINSTTPSFAVTATNTGLYLLQPKSKYFFANETGSAITGFVVNGLTAKVSSIDAPLPFSNNQAMNVAQISGQASNVTQANGSSNRGLNVYTGGPVANTDYNATALTAGASGTQATIADGTGAGTAVAYDINLTAFVAGSSGGIIWLVQESPDSGTTWYTRWMSEPQTTTGHIRIPALTLYGRRRLAWSTVNNVTITSGTFTATAQELSGTVINQAQFFDRGNGITTSSTLALGTLNSGSSSATASYIVEGLKSVSLGLSVTGGTPATAPVITLQVSNDGLVWANTSTTVTPSAAGYFVATGSISARFARAVVSTAQTGGTAYTLGFVSIYGTN